MKKIICLTLTFTFVAGTLFGQDGQDTKDVATAAIQAIAQAPQPEQQVEKPNYWTNSIVFNLGFNQTGLWDWAAGGYPTISLGANIDAKANYAFEKMSWNNRLQLDYGFLWSSDKKELIQKNTDRIYFESKWGYKTKNNSTWSYSAALNLRTQFSNGFDNYQQDPNSGKWFGELKSGFMAPGYFDVALGMDWTPANWFSMSLAPLTGGFTVCTIEGLRSTYGMKLRQEDLDPEIGANYRSSLFQFGAQLKANCKVSINDKFNYETQLVMFYDYLNKPVFTKFPIRTNWDNKISWLITERFKLGLDTWLIYDPNVKFPGAGEGEFTDKVQFKEYLTLSFTYTIKNK